MSDYGQHHPGPAVPDSSAAPDPRAQDDRVVVQLGTTPRGPTAWSPSAAAPHVLVRGQMTGHPEFVLHRGGAAEEVNAAQLVAAVNEVLSSRLEDVRRGGRDTHLPPVVIVVRWKSAMGRPAHELEPRTTELGDLLETVARMGRALAVHLVVATEADDPTVPHGVVVNARKVSVDEISLDVTPSALEGAHRGR
ncbi:MAG: hypothetical protein AAGC63_06220 [Propionicimonas sp.]